MDIMTNETCNKLLEELGCNVEELERKIKDGIKQKEKDKELTYLDIVKQIP